MKISKQLLPYSEVCIIGEQNKKTLKRRFHEQTNKEIAISAHPKDKIWKSKYPILECKSCVYVTPLIVIRSSNKSGYFYEKKSLEWRKWKYS